MTLRFILRLIRLVCYLALAIVGGAVLIVAIVEAFNLCPGFSANTGLSCRGAWYEGLANAAMGLLMMSLLTLVPGVLAVAGLIFAIVDLVRRRRTPGAD